MSPKRVPAEDVDPAPLGQSLQFEFSGRTALNRFLKSAMSEKFLSWNPRDLEDRGFPSSGLINLYKRWGEGGWGVLLTGNVMLNYDHLEGPGNAIIPHGSLFSGKRFDAFKALAHGANKHGSLIVAQLDVQLEGRTLGSLFAKPRAMMKKDFEDVIESFAHAAEYCYQAGFDGIRLNAAHGYLLTQFLSPTTNLRTDQYGGSIESRSRIIFEITDASIAAGIQMRLVENDKHPLDLSQEKDMDVFMTTLQRLLGEMSQNADGSKYGFADIVDFPLNPFGSPYSEQCD
ncbi:FMN-linked oxidoreductase [Penicillium vulpinum]|uniref:NADH:flavin oxidoreductase/NADH oxidase N-terminal domain-containing protein n=1 Tax=Penicillium vulpinum TaxID=29845 RepID=A0A1V6SF24_9EURO|nr:FMN-linked oxidoreductase [Penicillium vulpinum]KAJ5958934.1 FMN-linked oxidoreductase [Penicillium vulpinum]OQE12601.1 hypothetical protein PENVUL_c001G03501 [Penicillium vulpinum]